MNAHYFVKNKNLSQGFTLIELLVVISIIALLASLVLTNVVHIRTAAKNARIAGDMHQLDTAMELYYAKNDTYPPATQNFWPGTSIDKSTVPGFINNLLVDQDMASQVKTVGYVYWYVYIDATTSGTDFTDLCPVESTPLESALFYTFTDDVTDPADLNSTHVEGRANPAFPTCTWFTGDPINCSCFYQ